MISSFPYIIRFQIVDRIYIIGQSYFEHSEVQANYSLIWVSFHQITNFFLSQLLRGTTYILLLALCLILTLIIFEKLQIFVTFIVDFSIQWIINN